MQILAVMAEDETSLLLAIGFSQSVTTTLWISGGGIAFVTKLMNNLPAGLIAESAVLIAFFFASMFAILLRPAANGAEPERAVVVGAARRSCRAYPSETEAEAVEMPQTFLVGRCWPARPSKKATFEFGLERHRRAAQHVEWVRSSERHGFARGSKAKPSYFREPLAAVRVCFSRSHFLTEMAGFNWAFGGSTPCMEALLKAA
jgi:hypothetical protein